MKQMFQKYESFWHEGLAALILEGGSKPVETLSQESKITAHGPG